MKRKFSHEEIIITSVIVTMCASIAYCFGSLIYNIATNGIGMTI